MMPRKSFPNKQQLWVRKWFLRLLVSPVLAVALLSASAEAHPMKKIIKHMIKHGYDQGHKSIFLGLKGVLVPIPIPMKVTLPNIKLPTISFKGKDEDSGGGDGGDDEKVKYVPIPVPVKGGGGWSGGGWPPQSVGDWNAGAGWASSMQGWKAPAEQRWKGDQEWDGEGRPWRWQGSRDTGWGKGSGETGDWRSGVDEKWENSEWQRNSDVETDWDDEYR